MLTTDRELPAAIRVDLGAIFVSLELSRKTWLATSLSPGAGEKMSRHSLAAGDVSALLALLGRLRRQTLDRTGREARIVCIQEAGFDGFWLHRVLESEGVESWVVDPASVAVNRRRRRAKTDNIDGAALLRTLLGFKRGEPRVCSMAYPPPPETEDRRRPCRERAALLRERIAHTNRIKGLLFSQGIVDYDPMPKKRRRERLEALKTGDGRPLPARMKAQILRELDRLELVLGQLAAVEAERDALLAPSPRNQPGSEPVAGADPAAASGAAEPAAPGAALTRLKGIAEERAAVLGGECLWRKFDNRRQVGAYSGLVGSPFKSGQIDHEQGLSKAGNARLRHTMIELAWSWLQHQPTSQLSQWFHRRLGPHPDKRRRKVLIAALARKLLIALWRFETQGVVPEGAVLKTG
jgi:transposase